LYSGLAKYGSWQAQSHLGAMYERGEGVPKDLVIACAWYRLKPVSTQAGRAAADMANDYIKRTATPQVLEQINKAIADDEQNKKNNIERVSSQLTAEQLTRAQDLANAWKPGQMIADDSAKQ
jgi:TPR repeat protein